MNPIKGNRSKSPEDHPAAVLPGLDAAVDAVFAYGKGKRKKKKEKKIRTRYDA